MLAEGAHSVADTTNQVFLLTSLRLSRKAPDDTHPFGYGKERFFWSLLAAVGIFVSGAVVLHLPGRARAAVRRVRGGRLPALVRGAARLVPGRGHLLAQGGPAAAQRGAGRPGGHDGARPAVLRPDREDRVLRGHRSADRPAAGRARARPAPADRAGVLGRRGRDRDRQCCWPWWPTCWAGTPRRCSSARPRRRAVRDGIRGELADHAGGRPGARRADHAARPGGAAGRRPAGHGRRARRGRGGGLHRRDLGRSAARSSRRFARSTWTSPPAAAVRSPRPARRRAARAAAARGRCGRR